MVNSVKCLQKQFYLSQYTFDLFQDKTDEDKVKEAEELKDKLVSGECLEGRGVGLCCSQFLTLIERTLKIIIVCILKEDHAMKGCCDVTFAL